ncbi:hypothetical protein E1261_24370 [Kribbella albertanoniae]|uniref:Uncharacterized protein n=1 Tax=Kribbella albertanoniae TaxID=1266829 RepID=A0A4R4PSM0_9ACTN|nr:hypothetical protein E1261_24370 [Kribbella albertanoniae]
MPACSSDRRSAATRPKARASWACNGENQTTGRPRTKGDHCGYRCDSTGAEWLDDWPWSNPADAQLVINLD